MSLLKRIEQGQASQAQAPAGGGAAGTGAGGSSRLAPPIERKRPPQATGGARDTYYDLKARVQNKLLSELDPSMDVSQTADVRRTIEELFENILTEEKIVLSRPERRRLFEQIVAEILGLGPLEPLLADETITEIMVNGSKNIYIERRGRIHREPVSFESDDHLMRIIDRIVAPLGRRIDKFEPVCRRPPAGRLARQRHYSAHLAGRSHAHHPEVRQDPNHGRAVGRVRHDHARIGRVHEGLRAGPHQHRHFGRHVSEMLNNPLNKLTSQITTLELTNKDLERQIDELNEYIADLEGKLSEVQLSEMPKEPTTMDHAKSFIEQLIGFGAPLLDKHFELKQQQLEIERAKYAARPNAYQAPEVKKENKLEQKVQQWIATKSDNEEIYNNLTAIYYNSTNLQKFAELLNEYNPELYNECKQYVG